MMFPQDLEKKLQDYWKKMDTRNSSTQTNNIFKTPETTDFTTGLEPIEVDHNALRSAEKYIGEQIESFRREQNHMRGLL